MKVPLALRTIIGKREIVRSLRAASHRQAVEHLRAVSVEIDRLFRGAEGKLKAPSLSPILQPGSQRPATDDDVRRLTREWFWSNERASIEHERAAPVEDVADALHIAEVELSLFRDAADPNTAMAAYTITRDVLEAGKLTAAPGSPVWSLAEALAQRAIVEQLAQYVARLKGDHRGIVSDPAFAGADAFTPPPKPAPLLSICIQKFIDEHRAGWTAKTKHRHVTTLDLFLAVVQDKPITRITADHVRSFKDVLVALPANVSKLPNLKRLSPVAAAEVAGKRGMTPIPPQRERRHAGRQGRRCHLGGRAAPCRQPLRFRRRAEVVDAIDYPGLVLYHLKP